MPAPRERDRGGLSLLQEKVVSVWECLRGVIPRGMQNFIF